MIYPNDFEIKVGFDRVRKMVEAYTAMQLAREKLSGIAFMSDARQVRAMLSQTSEMKSILMLENAFPQDGYVDTTHFLRKVSIDGSYLLQEELGALRSSLMGIGAIVTFFDRNGNKYPFLAKATSKVEQYPQVVSAINHIIDSKNEVRDNASPELARIRSEIYYKEREATKRLHAILRKAVQDGIVEEDAQVSIRDGKAVIPVLSSNKKKIKGFIQDESSTGKTSYIEPLEVMELNNEIRELKYDERHEVVRILMEFTASIKPYGDSLMQSAHFLAAIDLIRAKARVAIDMMAGMPIISDEKVIDIRQARHPLLEKTLRKEGKPIVPLDLKLSPEKHILVISGPNAGGKSVCLKTMGLLQYMLQMGMLVPMNENSEMTIFKKLFIDIGDQQSIDNDLSTYSSHLQNMKSIIRNSDPDSLVMIDEFGTGTEPALGGAIAEVVLERIERSGAYGVITTHYTNIKYYASNAQGVVNGAMAFDVQNIRPLFRLEMGKPGSSFAFEIARKIGLPEDVVKEAEGRIGNSQINIERQLRQIARDKNYWETKRENIKLSERRYELNATEYEQKLVEIKEQKAAIIKKAKEDAQAIISKANREIERTIREIKEASAEKEKTRVIRDTFETFKEEVEAFGTDEDIERKIQQIRERKERKEQRKKEAKPKTTVTAVVKEKREIEVGDNVKMQGQAVAGKVLNIDKKRATVAFGHLTTTVAIEKLELISNDEYRKQQKNSSNSLGVLYGGMTVATKPETFDVGEKRLNFRSDIDLRGARVEEALTKVQDLVDSAIMLGIRELRILHGKGTGALKEEIRKYLRANPLVISAMDAHIEFGGSGITMVTLDI